MVCGVSSHSFVLWPHLPPTIYRIPLCFQQHSRFLAAKYLCFHRHSRFTGGHGNPALCFHRHSRFAPRILNSLFLPFPTGTDILSKGSLGTFPLFVLLGAVSKLDLGVGCRIERNLLPSCFEYVASHDLLF